MSRFSGIRSSVTRSKMTETLTRFNPKFRPSKKTGGTFIERIAKYLQNTYTDYREAALEVRSGIKTKPLKATFFFTGMGLLGFSVRHNPNEVSFRSKFIECSNDVSLVSVHLVNPHVAEHLKLIQTCYNRGLIRYQSFGIFSVIWADKYSDQCGTYETNCSYLKLPYRKIFNQVIDVGFLDIWWITSRKMLDYDVNY